MKYKDFCIFILTHGRPDNVITYKTFVKAGCTYPIYFIVDDQDKALAKYKENFGKNVIVFSKEKIAKTFDLADNFTGQNCVVFARNACFEIAKKLGYKYFLQLDDDYTSISYRFDSEYRYRSGIINGSLDKILNWVLDFYKSTNAKTLAFAQGGDFIGGGAGGFGEKIALKRKAMNTFFCSTERPFKFYGRINEDTTAYTYEGSQGNLFLTIPNVAINQLATQTNQGGLTDIYLEMGTYVKSFYTVLFGPSYTKIKLMGNIFMRLHHAISWNNCVPKIISQKHKK